MTLGVEVSERDLTGEGLLGRLYYVLGLFVLGGLDLGTPMGGPAFGRVLLWFAYFGAPLITASGRDRAPPGVHALRGLDRIADLAEQSVVSRMSTA